MDVCDTVGSRHEKWTWGKSVVYAASSMSTASLIKFLLRFIHFSYVRILSANLFYFL